MNETVQPEEKSPFNKLEDNILSCKNITIELLKIHREIVGKTSNNDSIDEVVKGEDRPKGENRIQEASCNVNDIKEILSSIRTEINIIGNLF